MNNFYIWDQVKTVPKSAQTKIAGGRLKGMVDIKPQWRYGVMTSVFGPCGIGWKYEIDKVWTESGDDDQVVMFVQVNVYVKKDNEEWSAPIPGVGGSMLIVKEKAGLHTNDEAVKMATTDALSTALKMLGVAADIYMGRTEGKYQGAEKTKPKEIPVKERKTAAQKEFEEEVKKTEAAGILADEIPVDAYDDIDYEKQMNEDIGTGIKQVSDAERATQAQRRKLFAMCKERKLQPESIDVFNQWLKERYKESTLSKKSMSKIFDDFEAIFERFLSDM